MPITIQDTVSECTLNSFGYIAFDKFITLYQIADLPLKSSKTKAASNNKKGNVK
jgi:hypothetical protein